MAYWAWPILKWLLAAATLATFALVLGVYLYEDFIRPRMVPRAEIEALVDDVIRNHPDDPEWWAFREEYVAWHRCDGFKTGKWHRVRKALRKRLRATGYPPPPEPGEHPF